VDEQQVVLHRGGHVQACTYVTTAQCSTNKHHRLMAQSRRLTWGTAASDVARCHGAKRQQQQTPGPGCFHTQTTVPSPLQPGIALLALSRCAISL
jgi:hypothetical protein